MKKIWPENVLTKNNLGKLPVPFKSYLLATFIINTLIIVIILLIQSKLPPQIPLFYGLPESEEQLAPSWALIVPSLAALTIGLTNLLICLFVKDEFIKKALIFSALVAFGFA